VPLRVVVSGRAGHGRVAGFEIREANEEVTICRATQRFIEHPGFEQRGQLDEEI
jgi:hypothetical protein